MWMTILKNAKGHFVELERMLKGVDRKYIKGDLYFPRDKSLDFYENLWRLIQQEVRRKTGFGAFGMFADDSPNKMRFNIVTNRPATKNKPARREIQEYTVSLKVKPLITPTKRQAAGWKGMTIKPQEIEGNWKTPEAAEEYKKMRGELAKLKELYTEEYFKPSRYGGRGDFDTRIKPAHESFYNSKIEEFNEYIKENMVSEEERKDEHSRLPRIGNRLPVNIDEGSIVSHIDEEAWNKAHKGHFVLRVYEKGRKIVNVKLILKLGINPPPRNPWSFPPKSEMKRDEYGDFKEAQLTWRKYWAEYEKYQESDEYKTQEKIQAALMRVLELAEEYESEKEGLGDIFG